MSIVEAAARVLRCKFFFFVCFREEISPRALNKCGFRLDPSPVSGSGCASFATKHSEKAALTVSTALSLTNSGARMIHGCNLWSKARELVNKRNSSRLSVCRPADRPRRSVLHELFRLETHSHASVLATRPAFAVFTSECEN